MPLRIPLNRRTRAAREPIGVSQCSVTGEVDPPSVSKSGSGSERARRPRFGDAMADTNSRAKTGSIAVSFAVVSRKHWPR
jgi:hypothetical protein